MGDRVRLFAELFFVAAFPLVWNLNANFTTDIGIYKEPVGMMLFFTFTNVLNHFQPGYPIFSLTSPTTFGQIAGQTNTLRNMEFGLRIRF